MDQHKLRSLVFEKTGVKLDVEDPVFALVALNEAVLEEAVERHIARLDAASQELAQQARLAGGLAPRPGRDGAARDAADEHGTDAAPQLAAPGQAPAPSSGAVRPIATQAVLVTPRELRLLAAAAGVAVLSALVVLGGQAAFRKADGGLSTEQALALQRAHKLEQAVQKLDPKIRAELQAELQK